MPDPETPAAQTPGVQTPGAQAPGAQTPASHELISSDRVIGTNVYGQDRLHIGKVERLVIDKRSGHVLYAVLSFGGFLGFGADHYPVPWQKLDYDAGLEGFRINVTRQDVEGAPSIRPHEDIHWDAEHGRLLYKYYGIEPMWNRPVA